jgi:hypothetical protein
MKCLFSLTILTIPPNATHVNLKKKNIVYPKMKNCTVVEQKSGGQKTV